MSPPSVDPVDARRLRELLVAPAVAAGRDDPELREAAVLVPLFRRAGRLHAVLTLRRGDLRRHAGEISFPGGRQEGSDEDLRRTALREAEEEIGLAPEAVELVGALPARPTWVSGYRIHPFVGLIEPAEAWALQPAEVEQVLELALADLLAGFGRRRLRRGGLTLETPAYAVGPHLVWGATARIVSDLLARVRPLVEER